MTAARERAAKIVALYAKRDAPFAWTYGVAWADGQPLTLDELRGFGSVLAALVSPESWRLGSAVAAALTPAGRAAAAEAVVDLQPVSCKRGETWSTYAFGVFASQMPLEGWLPRQLGRERPVLELVIRVLEARGTPTALRGLEALAGTKARRAAAAALERVAQRGGDSPDELLDCAFLGVGGPALVARMENAMILGRPLRPSHVRRLLEDPHTHEALRGLVLDHDGERFLIEDALTRSVEPPFRATRRPCASPTPRGNEASRAGQYAHRFPNATARSWRAIEQVSTRSSSRPDASSPTPRRAHWRPAATSRVPTIQTPNASPSTCVGWAAMLTSRSIAKDRRGASSRCRAGARTTSTIPVCGAKPRSTCAPSHVSCCPEAKTKPAEEERRNPSRWCGASSNLARASSRSMNHAASA